MVTSEDEGSNGEQDSANTCQQEVGAIGVSCEAELTTETAQPEDGWRPPGLVNAVDEEGRQQDEDKDAAHAFQGVDPQILDIQPLLLIKAVGMLDLGPVAPLGIHGLGVFGVGDRDIGEQDKLALQIRIVGHQGPDDLLAGGYAQL